MTDDGPAVRAVTFDLDDTLVAYRRSPGEVLAAAFEESGVEPLFPVEAYHERFAEFNDRTGSMDDLREACFAALASDRGHDPALGASVAEAFAAARDHANVAWRPGAAALLDALDDAGVPFAVVTNGPPDAQAEKAAAVGLDERAATVVYAGHDAPAKPDPGAFDPALDAIGTRPRETLHVGDGDADVTGARRAGLRAVRVGGADDGRADRRVDGLGELLDADGDWSVALP